MYAKINFKEVRVTPLDVFPIWVSTLKSDVVTANTTNCAKNLANGGNIVKSKFAVPHIKKTDSDSCKPSQRKRSGAM
jgi:hypothetical protein